MLFSISVLISDAGFVCALSSKHMQNLKGHAIILGPVFMLQRAHSFIEEDVGRSFSNYWIVAHVVVIIFSVCLWKNIPQDCF